MFKNGVRAYFSANKNTVQNSTHELAGPKGKVLYDIGLGLADLVRPDAAGGLKRHRLSLPDFEKVSYMAAYEELIGLIENGGEGVSTGREARKTVQILTGFLKSQQAGGALVDVSE